MPHSDDALNLKACLHVRRSSCSCTHPTDCFVQEFTCDIILTNWAKRYPSKARVRKTEHMICAATFSLASE